jgi:hypothetical protein
MEDAYRRAMLLNARNPVTNPRQQAGPPLPEAPANLPALPQDAANTLMGQRPQQGLTLEQAMLAHRQAMQQPAQNGYQNPGAFMPGSGQAQAVPVDAPHGPGPPVLQHGSMVCSDKGTGTADCGSPFHCDPGFPDGYARRIRWKRSLTRKRSGGPRRKWWTS